MTHYYACIVHLYLQLQYTYAVVLAICFEKSSVKSCVLACPRKWNLFRFAFVKTFFHPIIYLSIEGLLGW